MGVSLTRSAPCFCNKPLVICTHTQTHTCRQQAAWNTLAGWWRGSRCDQLPDQQLHEHPCRHLAAAVAATAAQSSCSCGPCSWVLIVLCDCLPFCTHLVSTLVLSDLQPHDTCTRNPTFRPAQRIAAALWLVPASFVGGYNCCQAVSDDQMLLLLLHTVPRPSPPLPECTRGDPVPSPHPVLS